MIDTTEGRTSVWEYLNPIDVAKFAYFNPLGSAVYGPWRALAAGKGINVPGVLPIRGVRFSELFVSAGNVIKGEGAFVTRLSNAGRTVGRGLLGGVRGLGTADRMAATEAMAYVQGGRSAWLNRLLHNTVQMRKSGAITQEAAMGRLGIASDVANFTKGMIAARPGAVTLGRAGMIWAGRVINPVMNVLLAAQAIKFVGETTFKAVRATAEAVNRATERAYNLDLGGELSRGFLTGAAATERQRALQAIQSSHLGGRSALGQEASYVHG